MAVSRGYALVCSAALHTFGVGAAGWATHARYREPAIPTELATTRAYTLQFLTLTRPKPRPDARPLRRAVKVRRPPRPMPAAVSPPASLATPPTMASAPRASSLRIRELAPGAVAAVTRPPFPQPSEPQRPPLARGVDRAAALVTPAGSACPELPLPDRGAARQVVVAVAFVVDTSGRVERSGVRLVESPRRRERGGGYYPRIYVVGTRAGREARRVHPAGYDSTVSHVMASHVAALRFRPAVVDGRPVRSTVLVACHQQG